MTYTCIIIDDEDQSNYCKTNIVNVLKKEGLKIKPVMINTTNPSFANHEGDLDLKKIEDYIYDIIYNNTVVAIATDYGLSDSYVTGLDVVKRCRDISSRIPIVLYSGNEKKVVRELLRSSKDKVESIKALIDLKIHTFVNRSGYEVPINKIIRNTKNNYINYITEKIREYGDYTYIGLPEKFHKQKLSKIVKSIENEESYGFDFLEEISEQTISLLIDASSN